MTDCLHALDLLAPIVLVLVQYVELGEFLLVEVDDELALLLALLGSQHVSIRVVLLLEDTVCVEVAEE